MSPIGSGSERDAACVARQVGYKGRAGLYEIIQIIDELHAPRECVGTPYPRDQRRKLRLLMTQIYIGLISRRIILHPPTN